MVNFSYSPKIRLYEKNKLHKIVSGYPWLKIKKEKIKQQISDYVPLDDVANNK